MNLALVTICTNRKRTSPLPQMCATNLPKGDQDSLLHSWKTRVQESTNKIPAKDLYSGRGFSEIRKITQSTQIDLWIISAGLGLISGEKDSISYNLTISPSSIDSIQNKLSPNSTFCPKQWWHGLNQELYGTSRPINELIKNNRDTIFVISLSQAYVKLIYSDLFSLEKNDRSRVRLLGLNTPKQLPVKFRDLWMPYDDRFDGPDSPIPGTRSDFPQRITRHFIENIFRENITAGPKEQAKRVSEFLETMRPLVKIKRPSITDDQIKEIIIARWDEAKGSGTRMLRILRDKELVACEQGRFATLFRQIKSRI